MFVIYLPLLAYFFYLNGLNWKKSRKLIRTLFLIYLQNRVFLGDIHVDLGWFATWIFQRKIVCVSSKPSAAQALICALRPTALLRAPLWNASSSLVPTLLRLTRMKTLRSVCCVNYHGIEDRISKEFPVYNSLQSYHTLQ
jgi:hypothetical protein